MKLPFLSRIQKMIKEKSGFTMIELLIVITILGILAVAVLSAINPIEQINRGRDTSFRSDSEQLLSAIDRYNAFKGFYPWVNTAAATDLSLDWVLADMDWEDDGGEDACPVLDKLSTGSEDCEGANELQQSFVQRISHDEYRGLFVYNRGESGDSTYVCFLPQSGAFATEAEERCDATEFLPNDYPEEACPEDAPAYVCLP